MMQAQPQNPLAPGGRGYKQRTDYLVSASVAQELADILA